MLKFDNLSLFESEFLTVQHYYLLVIIFMAVYSDTKQFIATSLLLTSLKTQVKFLIERGNCGAHVLGDLSEDHYLEKSK